ncbi:MAG: OsmC family protein [Bilophila wadsworthia]
MATITATYLGDLRVESVHAASGARLITDAPVDNNGKGEGFSPTDLCATALASCAMTIIGIYGKMHDVDVTGTSIEVTKTMSANPRRIGKLEVVFTMPDREYTDKQKTMIERAAHTCPVHLSLLRRRTGIHVPLEALALICRKITDLFRRKEKSFFSEKIVISKRIKNVFRQSIG